jgi:hypothetical protein
LALERVRVHRCRCCQPLMLIPLSLAAAGHPAPLMSEPGTSPAGHHVPWLLPLSRENRHRGAKSCFACSLSRRRRASHPLRKSNRVEPSKCLCRRCFCPCQILSQCRFHADGAAWRIGRGVYDGTNWGGNTPRGPYHSPLSILEKYAWGKTSLVRW